MRSLFTLGLGIIDVVQATSDKYGFDLGVRVGIGAGPAISGVIGEQKKSFDMWGAAVDLAKRMESIGSSGNIHISESAYWRLKDHWNFKQLKTDSNSKSSAIRSFVYVTDCQRDQP